MSAACTRDSVEKCIARKYLASLSLRARQSLSRPFITCPFPHVYDVSNECIFRRCVRVAPRPAGNVNISLLAPRASSPRVHVYNGENCAEFQPLKCVGRKRGVGRGGGMGGASRNARKSGYLKIGSRGAMAMHTVGARRLHTTMNAGRIAAV